MERDLHRIHIEGQGSKPIADMAMTSVTASAFSREESKYLILLLNPQPYWSGEALQEGLIIGLSGYRCKKTLKRNPLKLCLVL